jgi:ATP-dependent DNA ligase
MMVLPIVRGSALHALESTSKDPNAPEYAPIKELMRVVDEYIPQPVRETDKSLVFEVAFDSVHASKRQKSGVAMRFPRINRIRQDKPAHEADRLETLRAMVT